MISGLRKTVYSGTSDVWDEVNLVDKKNGSAQPPFCQEKVGAREGRKSSESQENRNGEARQGGACRKTFSWGKQSKIKKEGASRCRETNLATAASSITQNDSSLLKGLEVRRGSQTKKKRKERISEGLKRKRKIGVHEGKDTF